MPKGVKSIALKECGPRFEMKLYQVGLCPAGQPVCPAELAAPACMQQCAATLGAGASKEHRQLRPGLLPVPRARC